MSKKLDTFIADLNKSFDARAQYELEKNSENSNMQKTLADLRQSVSHAEIARLMLAANISSDFINRSERSNARFNVYAAEKVVNVVRAAASAARLNHYSLHIFKSIVQCNKADVSFTQQDAITACTLDTKVSAEKSALISQYQKHVAYSTATTQASSSLNALLMCAAIIETRNSDKICYRIAETEIAEKLLSQLS